MEARKEPEVVSEPEDHVPISQFFSRKVPCNSTSSSPSETQVNRYASKDDGLVQRGRNPEVGSSRGVKKASDNLVASVGCKRKKEVQKVSGPFEAQCSLLMERAREFQAKLSPKFPSIIKLLTRSHVTRGFWMGLPTEFCRSHLPKNSTIVVLEDENGKEYEANYLAERQALSGGWQRFSTDHKLIEGDVAIFQLIKPHRFKVYTIRAYDACVEETETGGSVAADSENFGPVAADFEDFTISVNGLVVDTLLSREIRQSYHKLCCSQKSFLHSKLIKSIDKSTLVATIIFKTVHIAKAIRSCNVSTSQRDLEMWDKTLKEFEELGMKVGFLRQRIKRLMRLALDLTAESERYEEVRNERDRAETKMRSLEMDFLELRKSCWKLEGEKKVAKAGARKYEVMFQEQADAPW